MERLFRDTDFLTKNHVALSDSQKNAIDNYLTVQEILNTGAWKVISERFCDYIDNDETVRPETVFGCILVPPKCLTSEQLSMKYSGTIAATHSTHPSTSKVTQRMEFGFNLKPEDPYLEIPINLQCKCGLMGCIHRDIPKYYAANIAGFDLIDLKDGVPDDIKKKQVLFEFSHFVGTGSLINVFFYSDDAEVDDGCWSHYNED